MLMLQIISFLFALTDKALADMYMDIYFARNCDTAKQYVQKWLSIVAAQRLSKHIDAEKELLMQYVDVVIIYRSDLRRTYK